VKGGVLAAILTASCWSDRVLGRSKLVDLPIVTSFVVAGNNLIFDGEMLKRTIFVNLDANMERPEDRTFDFDPVTYAREHRVELVHAALLIIRNWIARKRPSGPKLALPFGGFESYARTMNGILACASVKGFMETFAEIQVEEDTSDDEFREFVALWWERYRD